MTLPRLAVPAALLALHAALVLGGAAGSSITTDEVAHLPAGYTYVQTGDFRLNRGHPPLAKAVGGMPLLLLDLKPIWELPEWASGDEWQFGERFLTENRVPLRRIVQVGRLPMVGFGLLLGAVLFAWARSWWGYWPGCFVLFLFALCPNFIGHGGLVTTDVAVATFTTAALYALWRWSERGSPTDAAWCGVALGLALLSKYSALISAAVIGLLFVVAAVRLRFPSPLAGEGQDGGWLQTGARSSHPDLPPQGGKEVLVAGALIAFIPLLSITLGFGFPRGLLNYVDGLRIQAGMQRDATAFLWGQHSDSFWYYFLLAQWWKTPLPTLICFGAALALADWRTPAQRLRWAFALLPIVAFHLAGATFPYKVGIRYMLPTFPFIFLACGAVAARAARGALPARAILAALGVWLALGTLRTWPYSLSYFNELAGGLANGVRYLDDSNIDWGQDLYRLRDYLDAHPHGRLRQATVAKIGLEHYGLDAAPIGLRDLVWPEPGVTYVISSHYMQRPSFYPGNPEVRFKWLDRYQPVDRIGGSMFIYRFSINPADAGRADVTLLDQARWYDDAIGSLRQIVARSPDFSEAQRLLERVELERSTAPLRSKANGKS